jgi:hypothetical protein
MPSMAVDKAMWVQRTRTLAFCLLALLVAASLGVVAAKPVHAATFTVNYPGDSGDKNPGDGKCFTGRNIGLVGPECTLRAAIQEANKFSGADTIVFNIGGGTGVKTISPGSALPKITRRVTIDGYTQSGATKNTIPLAKDGTNANLMIQLRSADSFLDGSGLEIDASNVVVKGLVIDRFLTGIALSGGTGHKIQGNFIGAEPSGTTADGNGFGVVFSNTNDSTIGGTSPASRNLISGNFFSGVVAAPGSSGNKIQGNLIGTARNGTADLGNAHYGVFISSAASSSPINNNTIGDSDPSDGPTNAANTIAFNTLGGVETSSSSSGNRILSNSIFSNGGLGINLVGGTEDPKGVTANDPKDPDTGANRLQNYPVLTSAFTQFNQTTIGGELNSTPSTRKKKRTFIIQFFSSPAADPSGFGEGQTFLGQTVVKTNREGNAPFGFAPAQKVSEGQFITATATNKARGDTSESSEAERVEEPVIGGG